MAAAASSLSNQLSQKTFLFGLRLWVVVGIGAGAFFAFLLFCASLCLFSRRKWRRSGEGVPYLACEIGKQQLPLPPTVPHVSKVITEVLPTNHESLGNKMNGKKKKKMKTVILADYLFLHSDRPTKPESGKLQSGNRTDPDTENRSQQRRILPDEGHSGGSSGVEELGMVSHAPEVSHLGWGRWYTLRDLEIATCGFSDSAILGEGGYGMVYQGQLPDGTPIAVKNLLNNRGQAEKEFKVEVEAIGRVRHKNLVRLLGYCAEGSHRMLVYEYLNNGTLEQWLHGQLGEGNPIPWNIRMKIILGTSKGLAYLHEGLEPKVVHRDVKSSNILLDLNWNAKVSDFGLAKLLGSGKTHVTTRVMGTFGYVAPEYANTGLLNERSDVYSFGILFMELITGRDPVDYGRPAGEVNLVDWLKMMVGNRRSDEVADPRLEVKPSPRALKRALLVALRCVDPDPLKRPKMGQIVHMLESDDYPFQKDRKSVQHASGSKEASVSLPELIPVLQTCTTPKDSTTGKGGSPPQQKAASTSEKEEDYPRFSYGPRSKRYQV